MRLNVFLIKTSEKIMLTSDYIDFLNKIINNFYFRKQEIIYILSILK